MLPEGTSFHLIGLLRKEPENRQTFEVLDALLAEKKTSNLLREMPITDALKIFGLSNEEPDEVLDVHLLEDNVIAEDARKLPSFELIASEATGRTVFKKRDERLVIYTANRTKLEQILGVDLIYVNETRGNIVMLQYKMLEKSNEGSDYIFRSNQQLKEEIKRMKIPESKVSVSDYRLSSDPFFFKFVNRNSVSGMCIVSLDHLNHILCSPEAKGPRGGVRISYEALSGTYLRQDDITSLIRSGYIGAHRAQSEALSAIISKVAEGDRDIVLAWQQQT